MAGKIGALILIVIAIGGVVYLYNAGIFGKGFQSLRNFAPLQVPSSTSSFFPQFPSSTSLHGGYVPPAAAPPSNNPPPTTISPPPISSYEIPPGFTQNDLSPYFHQVRIDGVSPTNPLGNFPGSYGQISISAAYAYNAPAGSSVDVTGWQIKANHGGEFIPRAVQYYDPSGLTAPSGIRLKSGDTLTLYSSSAPVNLRLNACMGYLPDKSQFTPQLPVSCPAVNQAEIQQFSGACQNYIYSLGGCTTPDLSDPRIPQNDYACRQYLASHFTYQFCYDANFTDPGFLSDQVWVWMGSSPVDPFHDKVELLDGSGLLVDYYSY